MKFPRSTQPYVPMPQGWMSLTVVMDWFSRCVLSWRLSNTLDGLFCLEALEAAGAAGEHGRPWPLDGQRFRGAFVADGEIGTSLSPHDFYATPPPLEAGLSRRLLSCRTMWSGFIRFLGLPHADGGVPGDVTTGGDTNHGQVFFSRKIWKIKRYASWGWWFRGRRAPWEGSSRATNPLSSLRTHVLLI